MKMSELDKQLLYLHNEKQKSWGKIISQLKRHFDHWAMTELAEHGYDDFKIGYMPLLMNIHPEGITNNELAKKARVTKQAMSKVVKELEEAGYIRTEIHGKDKRSSNIHLTTKGKRLVLSARSRMSTIETEYEVVIGKKKFEELKTLLAKINAYHDEKMDGPL